MPDFVSSVWNPTIFTGKVVFCTGGNGSICSNQVRALVYLGADACIVGRNVEKTESVAKDIATVRPNSRVLGIGAVDVRSIESLKSAIDTCVSQLGGIDFLIAGAAGNFLAPLEQLSPNAFKSVIDIDVLGSYNVTKLALPHLIESARKWNEISSLPKSTNADTSASSSASGSASAGPGGRIIYVSATIHYTGLPLQTHVAVAKAGVDALSNNVAIEYGPLGITSNVIAPGPIAGTEGMERLSKQPSKTEKHPSKRIPLGRWGLVKEIADATVYLFSDAANYVTAQTLVVDGGAWRTSGAADGPGRGFEYPDFLLSGQQVSGVKGLKTKKEEKAKL
ncbi:peroxisomal 2 4-dienoyl-CoA reductase sps19 [Exophiala dermatitidis]|uniref:2,4-dienoyl-CoA reductase [(3E)-enoyl-CoA-producing] n=2 Tax=Exophiala dermatitidis TaxID=5970 RepID=H6BWU7_EXODN|nr:2,4-dienoyl-CoA reductase (NADPH2) [Exophiala dermatitidis NIH/UT8656]XP_009155750.1 2,4-dienoyl-CoA reductase (NADPH2), variant [Exophiala dermatitidis NIH/UT8656]KAJ4503159.1 peroxisomal 2 4-dienoyl-CoA reductase sps19 [Exophiala dermatitidis]EHY55288.1 2,4-dienoyl-CoA reductase (NADPH2), variant [Exophiala dermatitidis NIH/UT8656]EHY55289.1 2,4-dienoyl-CoA reductase (NADPH2) [Exophiala dermatitidis NIH/UT8656]KAJ4506172.1 peroxisomal 2 4-dienoyl-CoA reductase sps19 [Exophiala dermatitidi